MKLPRITLEQWLAFKTVVDSGSYARAAEVLNKSQSSVSYAVSRLNEQLPSPVLALNGRKAELTAEGEVLYRHASQLLKQAQTMEELARSMALEFEAEVTLALDVLLEVGQLVCSLETFSKRFPHTRVRILETSLSGTLEALLEHRADLVIGATVPVGFSGQLLRTVTMIPVAAPDHPVFRTVNGGGRHNTGSAQSGQPEMADRAMPVNEIPGRAAATEHDATGTDGGSSELITEIDEMELRSYRQVVLRDSGQKAQRDAGWLQSEQRWTVSHFSSSVRVIKAGLAFGFLPCNWVEQELREGSLRTIPIRGGYSRSIPLYLMVADRELAGPASRALADILKQDLTSQIA